MKKQRGFTLIELIIVIIILGILAAFAIPKYMDLDKRARASTVRGLVGSMKAAKTVVYGIAKADRAMGVALNDSVNIGATSNVNIDTSSYYPAGGTADSGSGIAGALEEYSGFDVSYTGTVTNFTKNGASDASRCYAAYDNSTSPPTIWSNTDDCS